MHFGKVWSDHSMLFCQFILSIYSVFHVICFCPIISWISCKPWTETYKCCVFSLIFISQIVKLFPSPRHFHGTSRIFPSLSIHFSVLLALLLHLFPLLPGQHRLCTAYLWHGTGEVQVTTAKTQLSHAIPCYLQSWFCFGPFWLNNVVLLVSLTVVSSNLSKLIISASAPLISVTSDVLLSAWAFKHLNISIEGHDASTRNWDANKPLTCLLIIACVVGDLFAKKTLHQSESNIHHRNEVVVEKTYERRTTVTKLRKQILIFQSWHAKLSQCQNWGVFFAEWTQRTSKNHDILVCFFPSQPGVTTTCTANFGSTSYATP